MYSLDPVSGSRRRALALDQVGSARRRLNEATESTLRDARNRGEGVWAELRARVAREELTDDVLEQRVRSSIGRLLRYPRLIKVQATNGTVRLSGAVPADEAARLIQYVEGIRGVTGVEDRLTVYEKPEHLPGVQPPIPPPRPGPRFQLMQRSWAPSARALVGLAGALLALVPPRRLPVPAMVMRSLGALALLRAAINKPLTDRARAAASGPEAPAESATWRNEGDAHTSYQAPL
jgi:hypothetical protein